MKPYIYGLIDPKTKQLRYVGQTAQNKKYPSSHWKRKRKRERKDHCHCWVRSVLFDGLIPDIIIVQEVETESDLNEAETFWIAYFKMIGCNLTNMTEGGEGTRGFISPTKGKKLSEEHKKKIAVARKGIKPWHAGLKLGEIMPERYSSGPWNKGKSGVYSEKTLRAIGDASRGRVPWNKKENAK
jgi:hypothetical protein